MGLLEVKKQKNLAYGKDVQLPANSFQRAGYIFIGWSEDPDAIKPKYTDGQTVNTLCDAGQTYECMPSGRRVTDRSICTT